jgi:hypothetical protein
MGWGGNKPNKATRDLVKERDARKAREALEARRKAAKTVTGNPSHYQQSDGKGGATARGRDGHHGD